MKKYIVKLTIIQIFRADKEVSYTSEISPTNLFPFYVINIYLQEQESMRVIFFTRIILNKVRITAYFMFNNNPAIAEALLHVFAVKFDPAQKDRQFQLSQAESALQTALAAVVSLDEDRILRWLAVLFLLERIYLISFYYQVIFSVYLYKLKFY